MPYIKNTWSDRSVERPLTFTQVTNADGSVTLTPAEGTIVTAGTPLTADKLNNLETQYEEAIDDGLVNAQNWVRGFGIGETCKVIPDLDLNTLGDSGFFLGTGTANVNSPLSATNWIYVINLNYDDNSMKQIAIDFNNTEKMFIRTKTTGTWSSWTSLTGEYGSNVNGSYLKHPDGTLECWFNTSWNPGAVTDFFTRDFTFPATFVGEPSTSFAAYNNYMGSAVNGTAKTFCLKYGAVWRVGAQFGTTVPTTSVVYFAVYAIGRWK